MTIRPFTDDDIAAAAAMSFDAWSFEMPDERRDFKLFIYEYIIRFYDINRNYSFAYTDADGVQAVLLAGFKNDTNSHVGWFADKLHGCAPRERQIALQYKQYLEFNGQALKEHAAENDMLLNLFISRKPGCGGLLLEKLETCCQTDKIRHIYLWSDGTCNLHYYAKRGFARLKQFYNRILLTEPLETIIYVKKTAV